MTRNAIRSARLDGRYVTIDGGEGKVIAVGAEVSAWTRLTRPRSVERTVAKLNTIPLGVDAGSPMPPAAVTTFGFPDRAERAMVAVWACLLGLVLVRWVS